MHVWANRGRRLWSYCPQNTRGTSRSAAITVADTTRTPNATHTNTMSKRTLSSLCDAQFSIAFNTPIAFVAVCHAVGGDAPLTRERYGPIGGPSRHHTRARAHGESY